MRTSLPCPLGSLRLSLLGCIVPLVLVAAPVENEALANDNPVAQATDLRAFFTKEAPVAACLESGKACDRSVLLEKRFVTTEDHSIAPGIRLPRGTAVRMWYAGPESSLAKSLQAREETRSSPCTSKHGGCVLLFAEGTLALPGKGHVEAQLGRFDRLDTVDPSRDTPGILQPLIAGKRMLNVSLHGMLDLSGLLLRIEGGSLSDGNNSSVIKGTIRTRMLDEGRVRTHLVIDANGRWAALEKGISIGSARLGHYELGTVDLKYGSERRWNAAVSVRMHGISKPVSGELYIADGAFESLRIETTPKAKVASTGLFLSCLKGEIRPSPRGPAFKGRVSLQGGKGPNASDRWRINGQVTWDGAGMRGEAHGYLNATATKGSTFDAKKTDAFCTDDGTQFAGALGHAPMGLSVDFASGWARLQGRLEIPGEKGLVLTHPLEISHGNLFYRGPGEVRFPKDFPLVGGDSVIEGDVQVEIPANADEPTLAIGWTTLGSTTVGLEVDVDTGQISRFGADAEKARRLRMTETPTFASSDTGRSKALKAALLVDDPQVNTLRKTARSPDQPVQASFLDIRDLVDPAGKTVVRLQLSGLQEPSERLQTAWDMLHRYYTTPERYDDALSRPTSDFAQTLYEPPRVVSPYLWGTKALRLRTHSSQLGLTPTAVPSTLWGAWGLHSNLGCAGHFGNLGFFGSGRPGEPQAGAEKRAFCWLGTRAHLGSRVDSIFDYPVGEPTVGAAETSLESRSNSVGTLYRPYKYNTMPGRSLKGCGSDRAPGVLDCDPYLVKQGLTCDVQQRYVGATRIGSCAPTLHEYRPLELNGKVVHFNAADRFGTLRQELRQSARSSDGSVSLGPGKNPLIQCPATVTQGALRKSANTEACTQPGQFCRAFVDIANGGVPSLGPTFRCVNGRWSPFGVSPLEAAGFPKACSYGGSWEAKIERKGDKFIGTEESQTVVTGECSLAGADDRFRGLGWGWWGEIKNPYCSTESAGPKAGPAGGRTVSGSLAQRAFEACSHPWHVATATRDWSHQLGGCTDPQTSLTGTDFGECRFTKTLGVPVRLVAWDQTGTLYNWEPLELIGASSDAADPRGVRYSRSYTEHRDRRPKGSWKAGAQRLVSSNLACREACDDLALGCLGYSLGDGACWLVKRADFEGGVSADELSPSPGIVTFLKRDAEPYPVAYAGDTQPCGKTLGTKRACSTRSTHTFTLSPSHRKIGQEPSVLGQISTMEKQRQLRDVQAHASWLLKPTDRNRTGLRIMALTNRRLLAHRRKGSSGTTVEIPESFSMDVSTQPSIFTPQLEVGLEVDPSERLLKAKVTTSAKTMQHLHVRFFVDTDDAGYDGHLLADKPVDANGEALHRWDGISKGRDQNGTHYFYALVYHRDPSGRSIGPSAVSAYPRTILRASPKLTGRISLGSGGKAGVCHHRVAPTETCSSIAARYGIGASDLSTVTKGEVTRCDQQPLSPGMQLTFAGSCGVRVFVDQNKDGLFQPEKEPVATTDYQGRFAFAEPGAPGNHRVVVDAPAGFVSREDFEASYQRFHQHQLKGSVQKPVVVQTLAECLSLCHPVDASLPVNRHAVRSDFKECGGVLYRAESDKSTCSVIITSESERVLVKQKRASKTRLYVRAKRALRSIHRPIEIIDRPAVLPRVVLHRASK